MDFPIAIQTVQFDAYIKGSQLLALLQSVATAVLVNGQRHHDGPCLELGQTSHDGDEHIRVVPNLDTPYFRPNGSYDEVLVTSYQWPAEHNTARQSVAIISVVIDFAERLKQAADRATQSGEFPEFDENNAEDPRDEY